MPQCYQDHGLYQRGAKRPDVSLYSQQGQLLLQIEVNSSKRDSTVFKLAMGLIDQNRYLKNRLSTVSSCIGFYYPVGKGVIEKVECTWKDELLSDVYTTTRR